MRPAMPLSPSSKRDYVAGIEAVLPAGIWPQALAALKVFNIEQARPDRGESVLSWIDKAARNNGKLPLTVIVGETVSDHRQPRHGGRRRKMNIASTCDGVAAMPALVALFRRISGGLRNVDFDAIVDEWAAVYPAIPERVKRSHLVIVGTPEVNTFACFLHGWG